MNKESSTTHESGLRARARRAAPHRSSDHDRVEHHYVRARRRRTESCSSQESGGRTQIAALHTEHKHGEQHYTRAWSTSIESSTTHESKGRTLKAALHTSLGPEHGEQHYIWAPRVALHTITGPEHGEQHYTRARKTSTESSTTLKLGAAVGRAALHTSKENSITNEFVPLAQSTTTLDFAVVKEYSHHIWSVTIICDESTLIIWFLVWVTNMSKKKEEKPILLLCWYTHCIKSFRPQKNISVVPWSK